MTDTPTAPERIWVEGEAEEVAEGYGSWDHANRYAYDTEYVRADLYDKARADVERLREALERIAELTLHNLPLNVEEQQLLCREVRTALKEEENGTSERI